MTGCAALPNATTQKQTKTEQTKAEQTKAEQTETEGTSEALKAVRMPGELSEFYQTADACTTVEKGDLELLDTDVMFYQEEVSDLLFDRIYGKSWKVDCTVSREELRYLRVLYMGFDGETHVGEMLCNRELAADLLDIFKQLYEQEYPIEKMILIDHYDADDELSMEDNNTSCFNFRKVSGSTHLSKHAMGRAVDINPLYNPYVRTRDGELICEPANAARFMDRDRDFLYKIDEEDLCYRLFTEHGFEWGGSWNSSKDYQHFQK